MPLAATTTPTRTERLAETGKLYELARDREAEAERLRGIANATDDEARRIRERAHGIVKSAGCG